MPSVFNWLRQRLKLRKAVSVVFQWLWQRFNPRKVSSVTLTWLRKLLKLRTVVIVVFKWLWQRLNLRQAVALAYDPKTLPRWKMPKLLAVGKWFDIGVLVCTILFAFLWLTS